MPDPILLMAVREDGEAEPVEVTADRGRVRLVMDDGHVIDLAADELLAVVEDAA